MTKTYITSRCTKLQFITKIDSPTYFKDKHVLFVALFHNNDMTMSQFHVIAHALVGIGLALPEAGPHPFRPPL